MKNRAVCEDHGTTNPCPSCRADHLAGEHTDTTHKATCRMCRADARPAAPPAPPKQLDVAALAANDDTLTHLTEV